MDQEEQKLNRGYSRVSLSLREIMRSNFFGGLAWGFGTVLGATIVVTLVLWLLNQLNTLPFVGEMINKIAHQIK